MKFFVLSRREIGTFITDKKHIVISIRDNNTKIVSLPRQLSRLATLFLEFADLDKPYDKFKICSANDAKQIWNFVKKYKGKVGLIVVQCEAGISRSAGVAAALSKVLNKSDEHFFKHYLPNMLVYNLLLKEIYGEDDWLDKELAFVTFLYKYKSFLGSLKRKDFNNYPTRKEALKEFYKEK